MNVEDAEHSLSTKSASSSKQKHVSAFTSLLLSLLDNQHQEKLWQLLLVMPAMYQAWLRYSYCMLLFGRAKQNRPTTIAERDPFSWFSLRCNFFLTACAMKCCCHELACCLLLSCCCNERSATHSQQAAKTGFGTRLCLLLDHFNKMRYLTLRHLYDFLTVLDTPKYTPYASLCQGKHADNVVGWTSSRNWYELCDGGGSWMFSNGCDESTCAANISVSAFGGDSWQKDKDHDLLTEAGPRGWRAYMYISCIHLFT